MNIRKPKELKSIAAQRLASANDPKRIVILYAGITVALSALITVINYCLDIEISRSTGLGSMGTRSVLSTLQTLLPMLQTMLSMCLDLGYLSAMLRIARGQYASPNGLRLGFDRFWVLLRTSLIQGMIFFAVGFATLYLATMVFLMTPLSDAATSVLMPLVSDTAAMMEGTAIVLDEAAYAQLSAALVPAGILWMVLFFVVAMPLFYQMRMVNYILIDKPGCGALAAIRESRKMMKKNNFKLFRVDLSLWWYYLALTGASIVCYGDMMLAALGVSLPMSDTTAYFVFFGAYLVLEFVIYAFLRNRIEVTYALAYEDIKPEEPKGSGVVLGNIFQM